MKKILVIGTGGTIASVRDDCIRLDNPFKIIEYTGCKNVEFECISPFSVLSENIEFALWQRLIDFIKNSDMKNYSGIIILHGSDTLAYTGALLANVFYDENICLVASNKPLEDIGSNGAENFSNAVEYILQGNSGVVISYDGIKPADCTVSADDNDTFILAGKPQPRIENPIFSPRNILVIRPYINIDYNNYSLNGVETVLHTMYHSATAPQKVMAFVQKCRDRNIPFYFVTAKERAEYESAEDFENIIFNCTLENAFARALLIK